MDIANGLPEKWTLSLDAPNLLRVTFGADKCGAVEVREALRGVRIVLRDYAPGFAVTESGRPVDADDGVAGDGAEAASDGDEDSPVGDGVARAAADAPRPARSEEEEPDKRAHEAEREGGAVQRLEGKLDPERRVGARQRPCVARQAKPVGGEREPDGEQKEEESGEEPRSENRPDAVGRRRGGIGRALPEDAFAVFERPGGSVWCGAVHGEDATGTARGASTPLRPENAFPTLSHNLGNPAPRQLSIIDTNANPNSRRGGLCGLCVLCV